MTSHETPLLSIVVPVRNQCRKLTLFLFAIYRYFENRSETFEIIVIDDGSRDQTSYVVEKLAADFPNIKLISLPEAGGLGRAARRGITESRGAFVVLTRPGLETQGLSELLPKISLLGEGVLFESVPLRSSLWPPYLFFLSLWSLFHAFLARFVSGGVSPRLSPIIFSRGVVTELIRFARVVHGGYEFELVLLAQKLKKKIVIHQSPNPFSVWSFPLFYFLTVVKEVIKVLIKRTYARPL